MKEQNNEVPKPHNQSHAESGDSNANNRKVVYAELHRSFTGPLPSPEILSKYNEVLPNAAERIISMAEAQAKHRQEIEKTMAFNDILNSRRGLIFAFIIVMSTIIAGTSLIYFGREASGLATIITPIVAVAGLFVYRQITRK